MRIETLTGVGRVIVSSRSADNARRSLPDGELEHNFTHTGPLHSMSTPRVDP